MAPVKTRMTCIFTMEGLDENEIDRFVAYRLKAAKAPNDLFDSETVALISSHCRGNRRQLMNIATLLLDEAFFRQEKAIGSHLILEKENPGGGCHAVPGCIPDHSGQIA